MKKNEIVTKIEGVRLPKRLIFVLSVLLLLEASVVWASASKEQKVFEADLSQQVTRPVPLPEGVLQILAKDNDVIACMKDNPIRRLGSLASWFTASEIHLNGPDEEDLVVLPITQDSVYMCFHSAEGIGRFWVFRQAGGRYELVLKTAGLGLTMLESRHNGYRDIESEGQVGKFVTRVIFRFESWHYREFRRNTEKLQ